ncbi:MAG: hypothetical protein M3O22_04945 [Pseudomonadota bacterium]|nr:hypothetical protein [Pseudomonadota bacterium]
MKYALLVVACLANEPTDCREYMSVIPEVTNATACHLVGQAELRSWLRAHEDWRLSDAYCLRVPDNRLQTAAVDGAPEPGAR